MANGRGSHTLWMVRHAPVGAAPGTCYGSTDLAADPHGTEACAQTLARSLPLNARVVASPLQRCQSLSAALQRVRGDCSFSSDPRLAEMHFGSWEMQSWSAIGEHAIAQWTDDFLHHAPGGGETTQQLLRRVGMALREALDGPPNTALPNGSVTLWITHAGTMRAALAVHRGLLQPKANEWPTDTIGFGQIVRLQKAQCAAR